MLSDAVIVPWQFIPNTCKFVCRESQRLGYLRDTGDVCDGKQNYQALTVGTLRGRTVKNGRLTSDE